MQGARVVRLLASWLLAAANLATAVFGIWGASGGHSPGFRSYAFLGVASLAAAYALVARARPRLRALLVLPSVLVWLVLAVLALMGAFLGPMDGYRGGPSFVFLAVAGLMIVLAGATVEASVALRRAQ